MLRMKRLPEHVTRRAKMIMSEIEGGKSLRELGGKVLLKNASYASIPIGLHWRLVLAANHPVAVLSHSDYDNFVRKV